MALNKLPIDALDLKDKRVLMRYEMTLKLIIPALFTNLTATLSPSWSGRPMFMKLDLQSCRGEN